MVLLVCVFAGAAVFGASVPGATESGGASEYSKQSKANAEPKIEDVDGKQYYYWPEFGQWKNGKLHVGHNVSSHPDIQWFPQAGLGLFMHWGIVSEFEPTGEAWSSRWTKKKAEKGEFFPQSEIWAAAKTFNPEKYDPNKWMAAAKKAGFNYAVLTTKHHDGYALWDSNVAKIGVRQSMGGRDLVKPYVEACRKNDMKVGFYYSGMDWYFERETMNFSLQPGMKVNYKGEIVDSIPARPADFGEKLNVFNGAQVRELIERFKPDLWWGDAGHGMAVSEIRKLHPGILCNNRGSERTGDYATPEGNHMARAKYMKPVVENGWWWESCEIVNGGSWHYSKKAERVNSADGFLFRLAQIRSMGGNMLANIAPRPDGQMPEQAYRLFDDMAGWMETSKESIYGINGGGGLFSEKCNVPVTCRDRIWYFHARKNQATKNDPMVLKDAVRPLSVTLLRTGDELPYTYENGTLKLTVPEPLKAGKVTDVVKVEFGKNFDITPYIFKHWK